MGIVVFLCGLLAACTCGGYSASLIYESRPKEAVLWAVIACVVLAVFTFWFVNHA